MKLVLASASPARLTLLRNAGIEPTVIVSDVDEADLAAAQWNVSPAELSLVLAQAKARKVAGELGELGEPGEDDVIVIGCDSILEMDGAAHGKPVDAAEAKERWRVMSGRQGVLHTGHWLIRPWTGEETGQVASTVIVHAAPTEREIDAYIATGEPMRVAGGFTLDGLGAPFVERIEGDPSNVIGLSLPLLRRLLMEFDVEWPEMWTT